MSTNRRKSITKQGMDGDNADSIKVFCRFRPPANKENNRRESTRNPGKGESAKIDSFKLSEDRNEVEFVSELSDNKLFKFDKV